MKIKLTALICIVAMLAAMLTGCGTAEPETTAAVETRPLEIQLPETTAATLEATEPTDPKLFFEEQGFVFWEGIDTEKYADQYGGEGFSGKAIIPSSCEFYFELDLSQRRYVRYDLADVGLKVSIFEYSLEEFLAKDAAEHFATANISNVLDCFFDADTGTNGNMTKEEWLEIHQDYKVVCCECERENKTGDFINTFFKEEGIRGNFRYYTSALVDTLAILNCADGTVYDPPEDSLGVPAVFSVSDGNEDFKMYSVYDYIIDTTDVENNVDNYIFTEKLIVYAPESYDKLAIVLPMVSERRSMEVFQKDRSDSGKDLDIEWKEMTYSEYVEENDHLEYYLFAAKKE